MSTPGISLPASLARGRDITDWGRMEKATVANVATPKTEAELVEVVRYAAATVSKVSVRGSGHSAGGHSFIQNGIMVDIRGLNQVLEFDQPNKTVRVQAGATWADLTKILEPAGLAVATKQEFDTFTIGGSVAANVHGKTVDYGPLIESIASLRILTADGEILSVSREENGDLFKGAIGGYGLLGIVVDVTFHLVDDRVVEMDGLVEMELSPLVTSYRERIGADPSSTPLCYGFLNGDCSSGFYVTYKYGERNGLTLDQLKRHETNPTLFNIFVWLQRHFGFIRSRAFQLMRSNSGQPEVTLRSRRLLLWDEAPSSFQEVLLQKFFVPVGNFESFANKLGAVLKKYESTLPVLTNHFRFVPGNDEARLAFSPQDTICMIPCYFAKKNDQRWLATYEEATHEIVEACLSEGGRYYLTFDALATEDQFLRAYPQWPDFVALKNQWDPQGIFASAFYEKYVSAS